MDLYVIQMFHLNLMFHGNTKAIPGNMLAGIVCILCGSLASILPGLLAQRRAVPVIQTNAREEEIEQ